MWLHSYQQFYITFFSINDTFIPEEDCILSSGVKRSFTEYISSICLGHTTAQVDFALSTLPQWELALGGQNSSLSSLTTNRSGHVISIV